MYYTKKLYLLIQRFIIQKFITDQRFIDYIFIDIYLLLFKDLLLIITIIVRKFKFKVP